MGGPPPLLTFTLTDCSAVPPAPVHASVNVLAALITADCSLPALALLPAHAPDAVQPVAFVLLHVNVDRPPAVTMVGLALRVTVGTGAGVVLTVTITDWFVAPAALLQERLNCVVAVTASII